MTVYDPMKFTEVEGDPARYITDDSWVMEQKMDGTRGLAVVRHDRPVWWPGRGGRGALAHTAATQHIPAINPVLKRIVGDTPGEAVFDGEIIVGTGEYHLFDVPYVRFGAEVIQPTDPFSRRRRVLEALDLLDLIAGTPVKVVRQARTTREKGDLIKDVETAGGEGVMLKRVDSLYLPGIRTKSQLKFKFVKTADVVVLSVNRPDAKHGSCTFGVFSEVVKDGGTLVVVGGCSLIGKPEVKVGDVIEVNYLYWTGSSLYQPRMTRVRDDKPAVDCLLSQFPAYSRRAV